MESLKQTSETQTTTDDFAESKTKLNTRSNEEKTDITPPAWKPFYKKNYKEETEGVNENGIQFKSVETQTYRGIEFYEADLERQLVNMPQFGETRYMFLHHKNKVLAYDETGLTRTIPSHQSGYQLDDHRHKTYSYIWLKDTTAELPNWKKDASWQPSAAWGAACSHITLVRERVRDVSDNPDPNFLVTALIKDSTHLTLRAHRNDLGNSWGCTIKLPASSTAMAAHPLLESGPHGKELVKEVWDRFTNQVSQRLKPDFAKCV